MPKKTIGKFKKEFRKSASTAIVAAFGFLIALSWKELIIEYVEKISSVSPLQGKLISTVIVTTLCVFGIMLVSKLLPSEEEPNEEKTREPKKKVKHRGKINDKSN